MHGAYVLVHVRKEPDFFLCMVCVQPLPDTDCYPYSTREEYTDEKARNGFPARKVIRKSLPAAVAQQIRNDKSSQLVDSFLALFHRTVANREGEPVEKPATSWYHLPRQLLELLRKKILLPLLAREQGPADPAKRTRLDGEFVRRAVCVWCVQILFSRTTWVHHEAHFTGAGLPRYNDDSDSTPSQSSAKTRVRADTPTGCVMRVFCAGVVPLSVLFTLDRRSGQWNLNSRVAVEVAARLFRWGRLLCE